MEVQAMSYNPEQALVDLIPEVKRVVAEEAAAVAELKAIQDEINRTFGDKLEAAKARKSLAEQTTAEVKTQFVESARQVWMSDPERRKFFTPHKLVTIKEIRQAEIAEDAEPAIRDWVIQNMPCLLNVNWSALKHLAEAQDKLSDSQRKNYAIPLPEQVKVVSVNRVEVNLERVAQLEDIDSAALVEKALEGVNTKLMEKESNDGNI
jgi:hypothetical protein